MILRLERQEYHVNDRIDVEAWIGLPGSRITGECWLERADSGNLCLLSNGELAFLMHLPPDDPAGWSSRAGSSANEPVQFLLANGEAQTFPRHSCVPSEDAWQAFLSYVETGTRAPWIDWHDENA